MPEKLYCYVDESGQDTQGRFFIVGAVVVNENLDQYESLCMLIERQSGKMGAKWLKAGYSQKLGYIERVLHEPMFAVRRGARPVLNEQHPLLYSGCCSLCPHALPEVG